MSGWLYILCSRRYGTLYVSVTNDLCRRISEHRDAAVPGFTKRYKVTRLVYFEEHPTIPHAIQREKNIKGWSRSWKTDLIERANPPWRDLWDDIAMP